MKAVKRYGKSKILNVAAQMLILQLSDYPEDNPKTTPKSVLRMIAAHNERLQDWSTQITEGLKEIESLK